MSAMQRKHVLQTEVGEYVDQTFIGFLSNFEVPN